MVVVLVIVVVLGLFGIIVGTSGSRSEKNRIVGKYKRNL